MLLNRAILEYAKNFVTVLVFLLLGLFVLVFSLFANSFVGSGTIFLEYNVLSAEPLVALAQIVLVVVFLAFFSVFMVVVSFAVRQSIAKVKFDRYLNEKIPRFSLELFEFFLFFSVLAFLVGVILIGIGFPLALVSFLLFVFSALLFFVPQAIVIDELSWASAVPQAVHFFFSHLGTALFVLAFGIVLMLAVPFVELFFDQFFFAGRFVSLILVLLVVMPFIEILKTVAYLSKFGLIRELL